MYQTLALGKKLIQVPEKDSFLNYVKKNNRHYEKNLKDKINFWRNYNKGFKMLNFRNGNYLSDAELARKVFISLSY